MLDLLWLVFGSVLEGFFAPIIKGTGQIVIYCITFGQAEVDDTTAYVSGAIFWIIVLAVVLKLTI